MRRLIATLTAAGAVAAIAVPAVAAGPTVRVGDDYFRAKTVTVKKGTTVTWRWVGSDSHNVVFKGFKSTLKNKGTYRHTFRRRGTFRYVCTLHDDRGMRGTVVVR